MTPEQYMNQQLYYREKCFDYNEGIKEMYKANN